MHYWLGHVSYYLKYYFLRIILKNSKKANKQATYSLIIYKFQITYSTILQYLQDSGHNDDRNKDYKNCLHRDFVHYAGRLLVRETLSTVKTTCKGAHNN